MVMVMVMVVLKMVKQGEYQFEQKTVRMRWIDFVRIQKVFPPLPKESASNYFTRLALYMKENQKWWEQKK